MDVPGRNVYHCWRDEAVFDNLTNLLPSRVDGVAKDFASTLEKNEGFSFALGMVVISERLGAVEYFKYLYRE